MKDDDSISLAARTCIACQYFDHCDPDCPPDEVDGYCAAPQHQHDEHAAYGGHWCSSRGACRCGYFVSLDASEVE
jgi:hypothetical protein